MSHHRQISCITYLLKVVFQLTWRLRQTSWTHLFRGYKRRKMNKLKDKYCDTCGKKFPPQHPTGFKDVDKLLAGVTTCTECLIIKIKELTKDKVR